MHQTFQKELYKFRIKTAKQFLTSLKTSSTPISTNPNEPLKLNAQVQGIGPTFKLILKVQNISASSPAINLYMTFVYDEKIYKIDNNYFQVTKFKWTYFLQRLVIFQQFYSFIAATCIGPRHRISVQYICSNNYKASNI